MLKIDSGQIEVALFGCGAWGINHARILVSLPYVSTLHLCDKDASRVGQLSSLYCKVRTSSQEEILANPKIKAAIIATPAASHASLVQACLKAGKHTLVEKPFTMNVTAALELVKLAEKKNLNLFVGYVLLYHPAFRKLKEFKRELGQLYYIRAVRTNFGFVRGDVSVLWDLAPHDISMILELIEEDPDWIIATGASFVKQDFADIVEIQIHFPSGQVAHVHLSWIDPLKERRLTVVGSRKMFIFDDMEPTEKLRIYDFTMSHSHSLTDDFYFRFGDIFLPQIDSIEPLRAQDEFFLSYVIKNKINPESGKFALRVEQVLAAAEQSMLLLGEKVDFREFVKH